jgi:acetoin utilization deacetylase AcuC-like enzyme/GNAT superfamily N-acetyltransferase
MFRIRRIPDDTAPHDAAALAQVQQVLREQFPDLPEAEVRRVPLALRDPMTLRFRSILFVAEQKGQVIGFALLLHAPDVNFCYLDFIATVKAASGRGAGGALYERVRDESVSLGVIGIFMEALPDDPHLCPGSERLRQNAARLRFYERYGVYPIINTAYETPVAPGEDCPPYLLFDDLATGKPLSRKRAREVVRAILERVYPHLCPPSYVQLVMDSIRDDPVQLRAPRYVKPDAGAGVPAEPGRRIALVKSEQHRLHHVRERGYVEAPVRIEALLRELRRLPLFDEVPVRRFPDAHITAVHDRDFVAYLRRVCSGLAEDEVLYPYVFPIRNETRPPRDLGIRAGYYCIDTFTPLSRNAWIAARHAVDCALTAAQKLLEAYPLAYALVRPPGHHAEVRSFGGFCYLGTAAIAAHYLSAAGRVAILDIDYHHGNGQQSIFWTRSDVLTVSIHGNPAFAYPYFTGFEDERGADGGDGFNVNIALPEKVDGDVYRRALQRALEEVRRFAPEYLVVALGLDTARGDPTGSWSLAAEDFARNGQLIGALGVPTLVVQEGGYRTRTIGVNARHFFSGLWQGKYPGVRRELAERPQVVGRSAPEGKVPSTEVVASAVAVDAKSSAGDAKSTAAEATPTAQAPPAE